MKIFRKIDDLKLAKPSAVTVGSFDGIHLGHQKILAELTRQAEECNCNSILVTFHPHPREVLQSSSGNHIQLLTPLQEKIEILQGMKLGVVVVIPFTREFSRMTYAEFVKNILLEKLRMKRMVVGYDHAFGRNREGHPAQLAELGAGLDFSVSVMDPYYIDDAAISSSRVRQFLEEGRVDMAGKYLGRAYKIPGRVERGENRGKKLGFPTANIKPRNQNKLIPRKGVYAVDILLKNEQYKGMMNIGHRPTFNFDPLTLETHIFNFSGLIYGSEIEILLKMFIRDERKFGSPEELKKQMTQDKEVCIKI
jgi:riboflavin kinase/FMN adenylyltransferase